MKERRAARSLYQWRFRTSAHALAYRVASRFLDVLIALPLAGVALTDAARIWLRHARLRRHLRSASYDAIVDGGASVGEFAALARRACPGASLTCVEPNPEAAAVLRRGGFRVVEAALWKEPGRLTLRQPAVEITSCSVVAAASPEAPAWEVNAVRLDALGIDGRRVFVKLDLQGAEKEALEGAEGVWGQCEAFLLEVSYGPGGTYEEIRAWMKDHGFVEAATFNELDGAKLPLEADKLFVRDLYDGRARSRGQATKLTN